MGRQKKYNINSLKGLETLFDDAVKELAEEVLFQIEAEYESNIDRFYNDYNPLYYDRTYSTYSGSSGGYSLYSPENFKSIGDGYMVGINIDSSNIPGSPYRADKDWVFKRTYLKGIHGINVENIVRGTHRKFYKRTKRYGKVYGIHMKMYGGEYKTTQTIMKLSRISFGKSSMSNLTPTPSAAMNKWWKKYTGVRNLNRMFNEIIENKLS